MSSVQPNTGLERPRDLCCIIFIAVQSLQVMTSDLQNTPISHLITTNLPLNHGKYFFLLEDTSKSSDEQGPQWDRKLVSFQPLHYCFFTLGLGACPFYSKHCSPKRDAYQSSPHLTAFPEGSKIGPSEPQNNALSMAPPWPGGWDQRIGANNQKEGEFIHSFACTYIILPHFFFKISIMECCNINKKRENYILNSSLPTPTFNK